AFSMARAASLVACATLALFSSANCSVALYMEFPFLGQWSVVKNRCGQIRVLAPSPRGHWPFFRGRDCCIAQIHCRDGKRSSQDFLVATHNRPSALPPAKIKRPINQRVIMAALAFHGTRMTESPRIIKKYPNRRLYDTANSGYITLADVK